MLKIGIGIVLYNQFIEDSMAYRSLRQNSIPKGADVTYYVLDNSDAEEKVIVNRKYIEGLNDAKYINMGGNKGLPRAYNRLFDFAKEDNLDWVVTSDQDTSYPHNYLEELKDLSEMGDCVLAPVVKNSRGQMSPFNISAGLRSGKKERYYINSGLCYSKKTFSKISFNENLFLDFVDYDIVNGLRNKSVQIFEMSSVLRQDFSGVTKTDRNTALLRYRIIIRDAAGYIRSWPEYRARTVYSMVKRGIHLTIMYKDPTFMKALIGK